MGNIGFTELLIIAVIVLLLFGAKRLPEIGGSIGKGIREFKRSLTDVDTPLPPNGGQQQNQLGGRQYENPPAEPPAQGGPKRLSQ
jgi:sec-independent protein translocase protein TatA